MHLLLNILLKGKILHVGDAHTIFLLSPGIAYLSHHLCTTCTGFLLMFFQRSFPGSEVSKSKDLLHFKASTFYICMVQNFI